MTAGNDGLGAPGASSTKEGWRSWARKSRLELDPHALGAAVAANLASWSTYRNARNVLVYLAFAGEPDLESLLHDGSKRFVVTRTGVSGDLSLHELDHDTLELHRFGFRQPPSASPTVPTGLVDLALVPGLAFDRLGNRLGFGKGYYDRLLSTLPGDVPLVGVTPARLLVPRLPSEPLDVRMTHLVTEESILPVPL